MKYKIIFKRTKQSPGSFYVQRKILGMWFYYYDPVLERPYAFPHEQDARNFIDNKAAKRKRVKFTVVIITKY